MSKTERESGTELARIVTILGIIVLHYCNPQFGGALEAVEKGSFNDGLLHYLTSVFCCGVDLFMIISGYYMARETSVSLWKPIRLIVQVVVFKVLTYMLGVFVYGNGFSTKYFLLSFLPSNYFVILYCTVYVVSPFVNLLLQNLERRSLRALIFWCLLLFSVLPTTVDVLQNLRGGVIEGLSTISMFGSQWGYSFVDFLLMYLLGAVLRIDGEVWSGLSRRKLGIFVSALSLLIFLWQMFDETFGYYEMKGSTEYCNPLVILEAAALFCFFKKVNLGIRVWLNRIAGASFTVYLFHLFLLRIFHVAAYVNTPYLPIHLAFCALLIYFISYVVHLVYHALTEPIFRCLERMRIASRVRINAKLENNLSE